MDNIVIKKSLGSRSNPATTCADLFRTRKGLSSGEKLVHKIMIQKMSKKNHNIKYMIIILLQNLFSTTTTGLVKYSNSIF